MLLPNCGFHAAGQRKSVRSGFLQSPSLTLGIEAKLSTVTCETGVGGGIEKHFLVEAMVLRSHKAREMGAYLLSIAVPLPRCLESATNLVNVPVTLQVQHRVHDARWYQGNAVPFPIIWQLSLIHI